jgi:hypothetical protein
MASTERRTMHCEIGNATDLLALYHAGAAVMCDEATRRAFALYIETQSPGDGNEACAQVAHAIVALRPLVGQVQAAMAGHIPGGN